MVAFSKIRNFMVLNLKKKGLTDRQVLENVNECVPKSFKIKKDVTMNLFFVNH